MLEFTVESVYKLPPIPTPPDTINAPVFVDVEEVVLRIETPVPDICILSVVPELYTNLIKLAVVEPNTKSPDVDDK